MLRQLIHVPRHEAPPPSDLHSKCDYHRVHATRSHSQPITHTPGEAARFFFHNSPPHIHPQKRGGSRQDQDICLCLNKIQNPAEMQVGRRFLFSVKHTPKHVANALLCAQLVGQTWAYTLMSTYTSLLTCTQIHTDIQTMLLQTRASFCSSHIHKQIDTNTGSSPYNHRPLSKLVSGFCKTRKGEKKKVQLLSFHLETYSSVFLLYDPKTSLSPPNTQTCSSQ